MVHVVPQHGLQQERDGLTCCWLGEIQVLHPHDPAGKDPEPGQALVEKVDALRVARGLALLGRGNSNKDRKQEQATILHLGDW